MPGIKRDYPVVDKYRYLGTWFTQKLTIDEQMKHFIKKTYFIRSRLTPIMYNASLELRKNLWQIFVPPSPLYEFTLPLFWAEEAKTRKAKVLTQLKKTVKLYLIEELMGYNMENRSVLMGKIAAKKW